MSLCRNTPEILSASFDVFYLGQTRWTIQYSAEKKVLKSLTCTHFQQIISSFPLGKQCKTHFYHKIAKSARNEPRFGMRGDYISINVTVKFQLDWQRKMHVFSNLADTLGAERMPGITPLPPLPPFTTKEWNCFHCFHCLPIQSQPIELKIEQERQHSPTRNCTKSGLDPSRFSPKMIKTCFTLFCLRKTT